ncbi:hypothetical protein [Helicobacter sp. 13S00482-2]|nr:hypothetical protein [Helicobacter sp. 13S00482-2]
MLKAFVVMSIVAVIFLGCALEEKNTEKAPTSSEETTWVPEQK